MVLLLGLCAETNGRLIEAVKELLVEGMCRGRCRNYNNVKDGVCFLLFPPTGATTTIKVARYL